MHFSPSIQLHGCIQFFHYSNHPTKSLLFPDLVTLTLGIRCNILIQWHPVSSANPKEILPDIHLPEHNNKSLRLPSNISSDYPHLPTPNLNPCESHLLRRHPICYDEPYVIGIIKIFMTYQRITMRRKTCQSHIFSKCQTICLMYLSIMKNCRPNEADIHISVPLITIYNWFVNQAKPIFPSAVRWTRNRYLWTAERRNSFPWQRQSVISELLLAADHADESSIIFNPFLPNTISEAIASPFNTY